MRGRRGLERIDLLVVVHSERRRLGVIKTKERRGSGRYFILIIVVIIHL